MKKIIFISFLLILLACSSPVFAQGKVYAWVRIYTSTKVSSHSATTESAFYTDINKIDAAQAETAKQNAVNYFNAKVIPYFAEDRQLKVKDAQIKTFATIEEADDARYAIFQEDKKSLNAKDNSDFYSTFFFNCPMVDNAPRAEWMSEVGEVHVSGVPMWQYFQLEGNVTKKATDEFVDQRIYFSEPFEVYIVGSDTRRWEDIFNKYFGLTVDSPIQKKYGLEIQWYDDQLSREPHYIRNDVGNTYREIKEDLKEAIENRVSYGQAMFTFNFSDRGTNNGEATSQIKCFQNCDKAKAALTASQTMTTAKTPKKP